jgi:hypothetical protein
MHSKTVKRRMLKRESDEEIGGDEVLLSAFNLKLVPRICWTCHCLDWRRMGKDSVDLAPLCSAS